MWVSAGEFDWWGGIIKRGGFVIKKLSELLGMREPVNTWTHFLAFVASIVGLVILIAVTRQDIPKMLTMIVYGGSMILLYGFSSVYHWSRVSPDKQLILEKLDHISIYCLIAGTYTPVLSWGLTGAWRWSTLIIVWVLALAGMLMKIWFMNTPRLVSTALYLLLGWFALIPLAQLLHNLPLQPIILMVVGGVFYTIGAVIYATRWLDFFPRVFGFHEIFHLLVVAGSVFHFLMIYLYIAPA